MKGNHPSTIIARKNMNWQLKPRYVVVSMTRKVVAFTESSRHTAISLCNGLGRQGEVAHVVSIEWLANGDVLLYEIHEGIKVDRMSRSDGQLELVWK